MKWRMNLRNKGVNCFNCYKNYAIYSAKININAQYIALKCYEIKVLFYRGDDKNLTNFDYIMSKMTERNFADIFNIDRDRLYYSDDTFRSKINNAFGNWRKHLITNSECKHQCLGCGNYKFNVFQRHSYGLVELKDKFREEKLSFSGMAKQTIQSRRMD